MNAGIDFSKIYENSAQRVWWQCPNNSKHIYEQKITSRARQGYGCPYCSGRRTLPEESFAALHPDLVAELHPTKNPNFDPVKFSPYSNRLVWWLCSRGHEWKCKVIERVSRKRSCKACRFLEQSLEFRYPQIAKEWHPAKNYPLLPSQISPSSDMKVWWQCLNDPTHAWQVRVKTKVFHNSTCPDCLDRTYHGHLPVLSEYSPELTSQWHPTKNVPLKPSEISAGSSKKVWWICPKNTSHEWQAVVCNRARKGRGCPHCHNLARNSLAARFPNIAKQWHPLKNGTLTPADVSYGSAKRVWWQCLKDKSHDWQATVTNRTRKNNEKCPKCPESRTSSTNSLQVVFPQIAAQWHPTRNGDLTPDQVTRASGRKVWWLCPENPGHVWQAVIRNRTLLGAGCHHCAEEKNYIRLTEHLYDLVHTEIDYYHNFLSHLRILRTFAQHKFRGNLRTIQAYYRMVFSSIITVLETYLSDAFYKKIAGNEELQERIIATIPEFSKKQYSLAELIDWKRNLEKRITEYLFTNMTWHNLPRIQNMYMETLGITFPDDITHLHKAVALRHDIVHRNGRTKSGAVHKIDKENLLQLISEVEDFVTHINRQLVKERA